MGRIGEASANTFVHWGAAAPSARERCFEGARILAVLPGDGGPDDLQEDSMKLAFELLEASGDTLEARA